ncbi:hypothetical protein [Paraglaciecola arctica]|uniref:Amino acid transport protein n=1 Tax=Paraglaciecola arctica BSs20135 TaxID=493475 RepID=K6XB84_9ALTE|nr:hypothetical protein [Paraglaciecola arctica]GAC17879.1 hypothetical protein GARC_0898 [Paraglaciecola arctica BSs20135]
MNTALLLWSIVFSSIGVGYFIYGKKRESLLIRYTGLALILFPYFFDNAFPVVIVGLILMALPKLLIRYL